MPQTNNFPGCCTGKVIFDLGGTRLAEFTRGDIAYVTIHRYITQQIAHYGSSTVLTAITNHYQTIANKALRDLGFEHSSWMSKSKHEDSKIRLWWRRPK